MNRRVLTAVILVPLFILSGLAGITLRPHPKAAAPVAVKTGTPVCGQPILNSPYTYNGTAGPYTSGTAGLPTFGTAGSDFPNATAGIVVPPETHDYPNYEMQEHTVYYIEPGLHVGSM
ncbi:MAG TPA: hypothetical protein VLG47_07620, partial [Candidatus Saccharimonadales bacterium]|nr:hypothetical protein [Candidatus Saccharimonadales bacterium]